MVKKIELPIDVNEPSPTNWDWKRLRNILISILIIFVILFWTLNLFTQYILANISIQTEKEWFTDYMECKKLDSVYFKYINKLPETKNYDICFVDSPEINAYATLWAKIVITKWFLNNIKNQEELLFVIAHEMGHIAHRDVLKKTINVLSYKISIYLLADFFGVDVWNLSDYVKFWEKLYSKHIELSADEYAIHLLIKHNVNLNCVIPFFEKNDNKLYNTFVLLSDHPLNQARINLIKKYIKNYNVNIKNCHKL